MLPPDHQFPLSARASAYYVLTGTVDLVDDCNYLIDLLVGAQGLEPWTR